MNDNKKKQKKHKKNTKIQKKTKSYFLSLLMGHVSVKLWNEGEKIRFKTEYNRFKERAIILLFVFPILQLYLGYNHGVHQLQSFFNTYYWASLALRENILSLNGSRIDNWWIYHHYISIVSSLLFVVIETDHQLVTTGILCVYIYIFCFFLEETCLLCPKVTMQFCVISQFRN